MTLLEKELCSRFGIITETPLVLRVGRQKRRATTKIFKLDGELYFSKKASPLCHSSREKRNS